MGRPLSDDSRVLVAERLTQAHALSRSRREVRRVSPHQSSRLGGAVFAVLTALLLPACGGEDAKPAKAQPEPNNRVVTEKDFDPKGNFSAPTRVDNRWHPLVRGTQLIFEGRANGGLGQR